MLQQFQLQNLQQRETVFLCRFTSILTTGIDRESKQQHMIQYEQEALQALFITLTILKKWLTQF